MQKSHRSTTIMQESFQEIFAKFSYYESSDFRISQILQLNTSITNELILGFDIKHAYNATPYHQIEKSDVRSTINLRYKFK